MAGKLQVLSFEVIPITDWSPNVTVSTSKSYTNAAAWNKSVQAVNTEVLGNTTQFPTTLKYSWGNLVSKSLKLTTIIQISTLQQIWAPDEPKLALEIGKL